jgi:hypothetical protein
MDDDSEEAKRTAAGPPGAPHRPRPTPRDVGATVTWSGSRRAGPDPAAARAHYLVAVEGDHAGLRIELGANAIVIGRLAPAELVLDDSRISRRHCRVAVVFDEVIVTDLDSSNGTFVDGKRIKGSAVLPPGASLQLGGYVLEHEWRGRREVEASKELDKDIESAGRYVRSLMPAPLREGPIRTEWVLLPSARLGGDVLGYHYLDATTFAIYLIDVSGHGTGAAMHAVSVINVLRQGALPGVDMRDPARVAAALNAMFKMASHGEMYLTLWYGVYDLPARSLSYCSAGHPPAYLVDAEHGRAQALGTRNIVIGAKEGYAFVADRVDVAPASRLYVFSDGIFEIDTRDGTLLGLDNVLALMLEPPVADTPEPLRLLRAIRGRAASAVFEDDFTLVVATLS